MPMPRRRRSASRRLELGDALGVGVAAHAPPRVRLVPSALGCREPATVAKDVHTAAIHGAVARPRRRQTWPDRTGRVDPGGEATRELLGAERADRCPAVKVLEDID